MSSPEDFFNNPPVNRTCQNTGLLHPFRASRSSLGGADEYDSGSVVLERVSQWRDERRRREPLGPLRPRTSTGVTPRTLSRPRRPGSTVGPGGRTRRPTRQVARLHHETRHLPPGIPSPDREENPGRSNFSSNFPLQRRSRRDTFPTSSSLPHPPCRPVLSPTPGFPYPVPSPVPQTSSVCTMTPTRTSTETDPEGLRTHRVEKRFHDWSRPGTPGTGETYRGPVLDRSGGVGD